MTNFVLSKYSLQKLHFTTGIMVFGKIMVGQIKSQKSRPSCVERRDHKISLNFTVEVKDSKIHFLFIYFTK